MKPASILCSCFIGVALASGAAASDVLPESIAATLKNLGVPTRGLSLYVHEIGQDRPVLAVAADVPRVPASTIKVLTTLAALEELGPTWRWKTEVYAAGPIRDGTLSGDLHIKGYGDPYLVMEHFWRLLRDVRASGLERIDGDLVLDQSYFAREPGDPAEFDNQPLRAYNVLPTALLVNFQAVKFRFVPQAQARRLHIVADPLPASVVIDNWVKLVDGPCRGWTRRLDMRVKSEGETTRVVFSGRYEADCGVNELFRVVSDPSSFILGIFRTLWTELGGTFGGGVREGTPPPGALLLQTAESPPLADMVRYINKYSNNVMTRQTLLTLGAERHGPPGSTEKGLEAVRAWLGRHGREFPELVLDNGAGLSRDERISARHLGQVLLLGWHSPYMPEFVSSLPLAGLDGTLGRRLNGNGVGGRMHLKTGWLRDVRSVAGYVLDRNGRRLVVVCLHNHAKADAPAGAAVQEAVLRWVHERP